MSALGAECSFIRTDERPFAAAYLRALEDNISRPQSYSLGFGNTMYACSPSIFTIRTCVACYTEKQGGIGIKEVGIVFSRSSRVLNESRRKRNQFTLPLAQRMGWFAEKKSQTKCR